jgi:hypothetical protein
MSFETTTNTSERRWGRISDAQEIYGLKRGFLYKLAAKNPGVFRKLGHATFVDFAKLDAILEAAPAADLR